MTQDDEDGLLRLVALQNAESIHLARRRAERLAEATLREQADLLNLTHDAIIVGGIDGTIRYWNRGAEALYGWTAEQAVGKVSRDLLKTELPAPLEHLLAEVVRTDRWEGEVVHTKRDGTQVVVASRWSLQRDDRGAPVAILMSNNDITERKRAEQELRESEARWRAAFEHNPTMYFMLDEEGTIVSVNPFGAEQLGYRVEELAGQPVLNVFFGPDREFVRQKAGECFQQLGRRLRWEVRKIRKDGTLLWVRGTASAVVLKDRPVLLVVCEDITERKGAEEELRAAETRFRTFVDHATDALFVFDEERTILDVNRQACESLGYTREELIGRAAHDVDTGVDGAIIAQIMERLDAGETCTFETAHRRKNGTLFPVEVRARRVSYGGGSFGLALAQDITERRRAEGERERLRQLEGDLAHINRVSMMGELTASLAHELNQADRRRGDQRWDMPALADAR